MLIGPHVNAYWIFVFLFCEFIIFIVETLAFSMLLREQKIDRAAAFALTANAASLILGGLLISKLPV